MQSFGTASVSFLSVFLSVFVQVFCICVVHGVVCGVWCVCVGCASDNLYACSFNVAVCLCPCICVVC